MYKLGTLFALTLVACSPSTSTVGQRITCSVDPESGVIASCEEGAGSGANTCQDIDEDGDGQPEDETDEGSGSGSGSGSGDGLAFTGDGEGSGSDSDDSSDADCDEDGDGVDDVDDSDDDNDGIDDEDDCDEVEGGDSDSSDLPYDVKMQLGQSVTPIVDAFAEKGSQPAAILSVEMDGGGSSWRLAELQSGATFVVNDADCSHAGNRDVGRDRVIVTWQNADGTEESDHLDLRYCD